MGVILAVSSDLGSCVHTQKIPVYEGPAKSFVTGFGLLQCYVLSNIFLLQTLLKHIFVTFLRSREKQINSLLLVSVGDINKKRCQENF